MLTINVIHRGDDKFLNGSLSGEKFNLPFDEGLYNDLLDKQTEYNEFDDADLVPA